VPPGGDRSRDRAGFHFQHFVCDVAASATNGSVTIHLKASSENRSSYATRTSKLFAGFTQYMASLGLGIPLSPVSGQLSPFTEGPELCAIFLCFIWTPVADPRDSSEMTCVVTGIWKSKAAQVSGISRCPKKSGQCSN
jgi:hypothetical protein